jgi:plasmid maintenance system antidote protein VapI
MYLIDYLEMKNVSVKDFAEIIEVHKSTIFNYLNWNRKPNLEIALKIETATKGKVTFRDMLDYWEMGKKYGA